GEREDQGIEAGAVQQAKADPGIAGQHEIEKRSDRLLMPAAPGLAEMLEQREFADLVERRDDDGHGEPAPEHHPAALSFILSRWRGRIGSGRPTGPGWRRGRGPRRSAGTNRRALGHSRLPAAPANNA